MDKKIILNLLSDTRKIGECDLIIRKNNDYDSGYHLEFSTVIKHNRQDVVCSRDEVKQIRDVLSIWLRNYKE